jgi:hypothetical protein
VLFLERRTRSLAQSCDLGPAIHGQRL